MPKGRRPAAVQAPPGSPLECGWVPTFLCRQLCARPPPRRAPGLPCPAYSPLVRSRTSPRRKTVRTAPLLLVHATESVCFFVLRLLARCERARRLSQVNLLQHYFVDLLFHLISPFSSHRAPLFFFSFLGRPDLNVITIVAQRAFTLRHEQ